MDKKTYEQEETQRMLPLVRSIGREIRERTLSIERLEERRRELAGRPEAQLVDSELSQQRRELRQVTKELRRLGLEVDELRILIPGADGSWAVDSQLDDTRFYRPIHSN